MTFVSALASIGVTGALGTVAGGALTGASLGGAMSALTGQDIGEGMGMGALTGGIGGGLTAGLQTLASPAVQAAASGAGAAGAGAGSIPAMSPVITHTPLETAMGAGAGSIPAMSPATTQTALQTATQTAAPSFAEKIGNFAVNNPTITSGVGGLLAGNVIDSFGSSSTPGLPQYSGPLSKFNWAGPNPTFDPYKYKARGMATGGITDLDSFGANSQTVPNINEVSDPEGYGRPSTRMLASGGISNLGSYSDGGQLLKGPGDGVSDDIPASIGGSQPARLAEGEFVVPARIVSELGNGSTDAGAKKLYDMMNRVQQARGKTTGKDNVAKNSHADKHLPA